MNYNKKNIIIIIATLAIGVLLGWLIFGGTAKDVETQDSASQEEKHDHGDQSEDQTWTCSMHPQVRKDEPGDCPICGMELIPADEEDGDEGEFDPSSIRMSPTAMQLASVTTAEIGSTEPVKEVRLNGKVEIDERRVVSQSSHIPGRVERLMVDFTGDYVTKGETIAYVYSPELETAQDELFEARKTKESQPQMFEAAKERLKNWKLTDQQIEDILASGEIKEEFPILADVSGYVTRKRVNRGDYIPQGKALYEIADLSKVWVLFDVYESETRWINKGDSVDFTVRSFPGEEFNGVVTFVDPVVDSNSRVAKARVEVSNNDEKLKPEMFVSGTVKAKLPDTPDALVVPKSAVMWTGERSVVYVKNASEDEMRFLMRTVSLGPSLGDSYIVEDGLEEGEEIAVHGTFSIDAAAQLAGKPSMMSPEGGEPATGHDHGSNGGDGAEDMDHAETQESKPDEEDLQVFEDVDETFRSQLGQMVDAYMEMKDALVASEPEEVSKKAGSTLSKLDDTDMSLLEGETHNVWMKHLENLKSPLEEIQNTTDLDEQRKVFTDLNETLYQTIKQFQPETDETLFYQFCPMANDDQGGYWFSTEENIRNP
ncbi:MAG: efflux RND transporter periplasmic adaptor subunit, partial [Marinilabilia sp.]